MPDTPGTVQAFGPPDGPTKGETVSDYRVTVDRDRGAQVDSQGWEHHAYVLTLHVGDRSRSGIAWHQGYGIETTPDDTPDEIVASLISDARAGAQTFEEFAADFGYDEDSRRAYMSWQACAVVASWLPELLGVPDVDSLPDLDV